MSVAVGDLLAHSNHGTAWPFGFCQARDALMLAGAATHGVMRKGSAGSVTCQRTPETGGFCAWRRNRSEMAVPCPRIRMGARSRCAPLGLPGGCVEQSRTCNDGRILQLRTAAVSSERQGCH